MWILLILHFISIAILIPALLLYFYIDWLHFNCNTIELTRRAIFVVFIQLWLIFISLILLPVEYFMTLYIGSHKILYDSVLFIFFGLFFGYLLFCYWNLLKYLRKWPLNHIVADSLREQFLKFLHNHDYDKAYNALIKATEIAPDETEIWCRLALFCELNRKNTNEADEYMAKAGDVKIKDTLNNDKEACYLNYRGLILYYRGDCQKGLEYIKQSIDIGPNPGRINDYEKKLAQWKENQKEQNNQ